MAQTAHKTEEEKKEYFDPPEVLDTKVTMLAEMILSSSHMVSFTGAGISTACGIPDYRSGFNTVLQTGPGCWETAANKQKYQNSQKAAGINKQAAGKGSLRTSIQKAYPSKTHMALVELAEKGHLKYLVSQNVDGLHRKSGIRPDMMSELHGNTNLEVCEECGQEYMRDTRVRTAQTTKEHRTGRKCDNSLCNGHLKDTIINFGENLNPNILDLGMQNHACADLCLAMGSSLRVTPAADLPLETARNGGSLVICNLQKTPLDNAATLCIYAKCDDIMEMLMKKLDYQIPSWQMKRRIQVELTNNGQAISVMGVDSNGAPYHIFPKISVSKLGNGTHTFPNHKQTAQPYKIPVSDVDLDPTKTFKINLQFQRNYFEPDLSFDIELGELIKQQKMEFEMVFGAGDTGKWEIIIKKGGDRDIIGVVEKFSQDESSKVVAKPVVASSKASASSKSTASKSAATVKSKA